MADAHLGEQQRGAVQGVGGGGQALCARPWGVLEEEGRLRSLARGGREGGGVPVPNAHRGGEPEGLVQRVCGGHKALGAGPGEVLEQEGGLWGLARRGRGPGRITVPNTHRWG